MPALTRRSQKLEICGAGLREVSGRKRKRTIDYAINMKLSELADRGAIRTCRNPAGMLFELPWRSFSLPARFTVRGGTLHFTKTLTLAFDYLSDTFGGLHGQVDGP